MTDQFIRDCEQWACAFNLALAGESRQDIVDEDKGILGYQIRFKNGRTIKALSSKPRNMRSKQARVVIDEAAFCDNLPALLKAAKALMIWGGSLSILSTHDGVDNAYNEIIEAIRHGEPEGNGWSLHSTDINKAIEEGFYKRVCLALRQEWTLAGQRAWLEQLMAEYGIDADEELLCIPFSGRAGKVFDIEKMVVVDDVPIGPTVRFWDLAATEKDLTGNNKNNPCYTAGVKMRIVGGKVYVIDVIAVQKSAGDVDRLMRETAITDGKSCMVRWELEGGSAGKRDAAHITTNLVGFDAAPIRPQGDKVKRAKPLSSQMAAGNVFMMRGTWNKTYKKWLHVFPDGKIKDPIDASSGAFAALTGTPDRRNNQPAAWSGWGG